MPLVGRLADLSSGPRLVAAPSVSPCAVALRPRGRRFYAACVTLRPPVATIAEVTGRKQSCLAASSRSKEDVSNRLARLLAAGSTVNAETRPRRTRPNAATVACLSGA